MQVPTYTLINYVLGSLDPVTPTKTTVALVLIVLLLRSSFWVAAMLPIMSALDDRPSTDHRPAVTRTESSRTTTTFGPDGERRRVVRVKEVKESCGGEDADASEIRECRGAVLRGW